PPEIYSRIFLACLRSSDCPGQAPLLPAQICGRWRDIALDTPALWSTIRVDDTEPDGLERMNLWLSRARNFPLTLVL
ncbi:hypothetical protein C8F01DRAFT_928866, partial [Mycena amicta]